MTPFHRSVPTLLKLSPLALAALLGACGGGSDDTGSTEAPAATTQSVAIDFAATVGSTVLNIGDCASTTVSGVATRNGVAVDARLTDLRFYVSNLKLLKADGTAVAVTLDESIWQAKAGDDTIALIDFENGTCTNNSGGTGGTNTRITGSVPAGSYVGAVFTLGVPSSWNHSNPALATTPKPIDSSVPGMAWSWQAGRKFTKIELSPVNATTPDTYTGGVQIINADGTQATTTTAGVTTATANTSVFPYHLGSTGCVADAAATGTGGYTCTSPNQFDVRVAAFNPASQRLTVDLQALFAGNNVTQNTTGTAGGCMSSASDPQCTAMFTMLDGAKSGGTVFRAIAK